MPLCKTHKVSHGAEGCPDCNENKTAYHGMQTPLLKVGSFHDPRYDGKTTADKGMTLPAKSTHVRQK